eukprot:gnl/MRDRNA2_/MRDRNA2_90611_c0_seq1.p1 gnl/MRDRNA2_/MRDRNA2_90611_c0~~gnl/MRDRNA2_/MRDRNA2_90611_c0_seq1.p1  ORF type:complete len:134 (-),score=17.22 gnl/MRDRNA2_/MRDRNA2_90611_c0_seq1:105-506(-)
MPRLGNTIHWSPSESSLTRSSFNAIVRRRNLDVTEIMMRDTSMGQKAMMGPTWEPAGLVSRKIAEKLTAKPLFKETGGTATTSQSMTPGCATPLGQSQSMPMLPRLPDGTEVKIGRSQPLTNGGRQFFAKPEP